MKGTNTLHLNQATMLEAINLWLAAEFKTPPRAKSVEASREMNASHKGFTITLEEPEGGGGEDAG